MIQRTRSFWIALFGGWFLFVGALFAGWGWFVLRGGACLLALDRPKDMGSFGDAFAPIVGFSSVLTFGLLAFAGYLQFLEWLGNQEAAKEQRAAEKEARRLQDNANIIAVVTGIVQIQVAHGEVERAAVAYLDEHRGFGAVPDASGLATWIQLRSDALEMGIDAARESGPHVELLRIDPVRLWTYRAESLWKAEKAVKLVSRSKQNE